MNICDFMTKSSVIFPNAFALLPTANERGEIIQATAQKNPI